MSIQIIRVPFVLRTAAVARSCGSGSSHNDGLCVLCGLPITARLAVDVVANRVAQGCLEGLHLRAQLRDVALGVPDTDAHQMNAILLRSGITVCCSASASVSNGSTF